MDRFIDISGYHIKRKTLTKEQVKKITNDLTVLPFRTEPYTKDEIKKYVEFIHVNLIDMDEMTKLKGAGIIFCRNVLIYFDNSPNIKHNQAIFNKDK